MEVNKTTHVFISVLNECIPSRFAFQQPSLMKQKIELGHFPELGKHLQKSVSGIDEFSVRLEFHVCKRYRLVDTGMEASYVQPVP